MSFFHIPVLLKESIKALNINPNGIYVDCTAGGGGHSNLILNELKDGRLIMIDRDPDAISVLNS
ncbi:MAG: 16S rRNA (cytosine(1402)-N(4))-methyltransferase, partial [Clostridiales bacterium]|nr:16S rRNA (cytosine(1402)-N(4))-methyltransferase [Clostridiales bacterium]